MTKLQKQALGRVALSKEEVEYYYDSRTIAPQCLKTLCESHERLRAELQGAELILNEPEPETLILRERLRVALALTDTGSREFMEVFGGGVPGWRVVEKIREVLLGEMKTNIEEEP